jgi:hypothetical protein
MCNENLTRYANCNHPKSRACKLRNVQGKPNKKAKRGEAFLIGSFTIANVIAHFTHVVKDLEF